MTLEIQTAELSPANQIMIAVTHVYQAHDGDPPARAVAAAVLAAAADQVDAMDVPEYIQGDAYWPYRNGRDAAKEHFLAIAAELGVNNG
jgi:protein-disulfide isomerase-like protein with CxxC motif